MKSIIPVGENIVQIGTKCEDALVWLNEENKKTETIIFVVVAAGSENNQEAMEKAERVVNNEMLTLRHRGFEMPEGFKPKVFRVTVYQFVESEHRKKIMRQGGEKT
jgi:hypothetical protein